MSTSVPTLSYISADTTPKPSFLNAFASGVILAIFLHIFAVVLGAVLVLILDYCGLSQNAFILPIAALPLIGMFLVSVYVFLRERWLGFLVGASISAGAIPLLFLLTFLGRY